MVSAREQIEFQRYMSNTAHRREIRDLQAAGLNPVLSAGGSGASTPSGAMDSSGGGGGGGGMTVKQLNQLVRNVGTTVKDAAVGSIEAIMPSFSGRTLADRELEHQLNNSDPSVLPDYVSANDRSAAALLKMRDANGMEMYYRDNDGMIRRNTYSDLSRSDYNKIATLWSLGLGLPLGAAGAGAKLAGLGLKAAGTGAAKSLLNLEKIYQMFRWNTMRASSEKTRKERTSLSGRGANVH